MKIVFTRESDNKVFEFEEHRYGVSFLIKSSNLIPQPTTAITSSYRFGGGDGGAGTRGTYDPRPFQFKFLISEDPSISKGLVELIAEVRAFFRLHIPNSTILEKFTVDFYTEDKVQSSFRMRHGWISVPFGAPFSGSEWVADGQVDFIFGDPFLYFLGLDHGGVINATLFPAGTGTENKNHGQRFSANGQVFHTTGQEFNFPDGGLIGDPVTFEIVSETSVSADIDIFGGCVNPTLFNLSNNTQFSYTGIIPNGSKLSLSSDGTVLLDGVRPTGIYENTFKVSPGVNRLYFTVANADTSCKATILARGSF